MTVQSEDNIWRIEHYTKRKEKGDTNRLMAMKG